MKSHHSFVVLFLILFLPLNCSCAFGQTTITEKSKKKAFEKIQSFVKEQNIVGLSFAVSVDGKLLWSEGFGYSDKEKSKPVVASKTMFRIASLSKPITSAGLGVLIDDGIMHADSSLYLYVKDFPKKKYDFTIYDLATHRSGIRHYNGSEFKNKKEMTLEEGISIFKEDKLKFEPGTDYFYTSYGYNLLGLAIAKASQLPFEEFIELNVLETLNMNNTMPDNGRFGEYDVSGFFKNNNGKVVEHDKVSIYFKTPSGGYLSSAEDLTKLGDAMLSTSLLSQETLDLLLTVKPLPNGKKAKYAMGWGFKMDNNERVYFGHSGGGVGAVSRISVYPEEKMSIVMLSNTNCDYLKFNEIVQELADMFIED